MANRKTPRGGKAWALRGVFYMALRLRALDLCEGRARLAGATEAEINAVITQARGVKRD